jgi:hypothetical protein
MASPAPKIRPEQEADLQEQVASFWYDPLGFVYWCYPWGEKDTPLEEEEGPEKWQADVLLYIEEQLLAGVDIDPLLLEAIQIAVASGHGPGKTALIAWIIHWFISTRPHPQILVTANTRDQLESKTWREVAKWQKMALNGHWFEHTATKYYHRGAENTWFAKAIPWSKERSEAFAGTHDAYVLVMFDESSLVDDVIFEVAEGAMMSGRCMWICFGNPTRNTGRFKQCFGRLRHRWKTWQVNALHAERPKRLGGHKKMLELIEDYGEDSDIVRVRVLGRFPRASVLQLIPSDLIEEAIARQIVPEQIRHAPKVLGCDVAWEGDDHYTIYMRQGLHSERLGRWQHFEDETMTFASLINERANKHNVDAVFVDVVGVGAGVYDRLKQLGRNDVIPVNSGTDAADSKQFSNLRMEMWWKMRQWMRDGGSIPDLMELREDLESPEYGYTGKGNRLQLEKKETMKARGLASPDDGDGLALTFAQSVFPKSELERQRLMRKRDQGYDPLGHFSGKRAKR